MKKKTPIEMLPRMRPPRGEKLVQCRLPNDVHAKMLILFEKARKEGLEASWQSFILAACVAQLED